MPIYNGSQKVSFPGIEKIYVGNDLVYQKQAPSAYRQLEYINFTSSERLNPNVQISNKYIYLLQSMPSVPSNSSYYMGLGYRYGFSVISGSVRYTSPWKSNQSCYYLNSYLNTKIWLKMRTYSSSTTHWWSETTVDGSSTPLKSSYDTGRSTDISSYYLGINSWLTNATTWHSSFTGGSMKVYQLYIRNGGDNDPIVNNFYPAQRKSDNVCGLYDTVNNVFKPMEGTNITTSAAGPVVNENPGWN